MHIVPITKILHTHHINFKVSMSLSDSRNLTEVWKRETSEVKPAAESSESEQKNNSSATVHLILVS